MLRRRGQATALLWFSNREDGRRRPIALSHLVASQQPETTVKPGLGPQMGPREDRHSNNQLLSGCCKCIFRHVFISN